MLKTIDIPTPCYVLEEAKLIENLKLLAYIQEQSGAKILLALKAFALWSKFDIISKYISGIASSGLYESRLGFEEFKSEVHTYSPAYEEQELDEIIKYSSHIIFNNFGQLDRFYAKVVSQEYKNHNISIGVRINPEYSEVKTDIYNPCLQYSRFGCIKDKFEEDKLHLIEGIHFHNHCEHDSYALENTLKIIDANFGEYIKKLKWINFGGGHLITKQNYNIEHLIKLIKDFKNKYNNIDIYLEPGEAIAYKSGYMIARVLDVMNNGMDIAILNTSATAHMPDVLEMPYRPKIRGADFAGAKKYTYRIGCYTCLSGDIIGDYSFDERLNVGDKIIFEDMMHYTIVKNTTFNGIKLPSIGSIDQNNNFYLIKDFDYDYYKSRNS